MSNKKADLGGRKTLQWESWSHVEKRLERVRDAGADPASKVRGGDFNNIGLSFATVRELKYTPQHCCE